MPGRPKQHQDIIKLDEIGRERVEELLEQGTSVADICRELQVGKRSLYKWLEAAEQGALLSRARARAADNLATETLRIADEVEAEPAAVQRAKLRIDTRKWLASKWDPTQYGDTKNPQVQISIGDLHLAAVKALKPENIIDAEVVAPSNEP